MTFWSSFGTLTLTKDQFCFNKSIFQCQIKLISYRSQFWHLRRKPAVIFSKWLFFQNSLMISWATYSLNTFKCHKSNIKNLWMKSSEIVFIFLPAFYLIIWLMTSPKNFEKISILKIWQLVFFWGVKIYFGKFLLKWCIFRHGKIWFSQIMPFNSYYFHLM